MKMTEREHVTDIFKQFQLGIGKAGYSLDLILARTEEELSRGASEPVRAEQPTGRCCPYVCLPVELAIRVGLD